MPTNRYHAKTVKQLLLVSSAMKTGATKKIAVLIAILKTNRSPSIDWLLRSLIQSRYIVETKIDNKMEKRCLTEIT